MKTHVVTDIVGRGLPAFETLLAALAKASPDFFQLRERSLSDRDLLSLVRRARAALPLQTSILVNGRPDVAVAAGAQGVQLPSDGLPARDVRRAFPAPFVIGTSCHTPKELETAAEGGADFALYSPIYSSSPSGPPFPAMGPEAIDRLPHPPPLPVFVLGGITLQRISSWPEERRRKVAGVAGIGLFHDPGSRANEVVHALRALSSGA